MRWVGSRTVSISRWTFSAEKRKFLDFFPQQISVWVWSRTGQKKEMMLLWNALACGLAVCWFQLIKKVRIPKAQDDLSFMTHASWWRGQYRSVFQKEGLKFEITGVIFVMFINTHQTRYRLKAFPFWRLGRDWAAYEMPSACYSVFATCF